MKKYQLVNILILCYLKYCDFHFSFSISDQHTNTQEQNNTEQGNNQQIQNHEDNYAADKAATHNDQFKLAFDEFDLYLTKNLNQQMDIMQKSVLQATDEQTAKQLARQQFVLDLSSKDLNSQDPQLVDTQAQLNSSKLAQNTQQRLMQQLQYDYSLQKQNQDIMLQSQLQQKTNQLEDQLQQKKQFELQSLSQQIELFKQNKTIEINSELLTYSNSKRLEIDQKLNDFYENQKQIMTLQLEKEKIQLKINFRNQLKNQNLIPQTSQTKSEYPNLEKINTIQKQNNLDIEQLKLNEMERVSYQVKQTLNSKTIEVERYISEYRQKQIQNLDNQITNLKLDKQKQIEIEINAKQKQMQFDFEQNLQEQRKQQQDKMYQECQQEKAQLLSLAQSEIKNKRELELKQLQQDIDQQKAEMSRQLQEQEQQSNKQLQNKIQSDLDSAQNLAMGVVKINYCD